MLHYMYLLMTRLANKMRKPAILSVCLILFNTISFSKEYDLPKKNNLFKNKYCDNKWEDGYFSFSIGYSNIDKQKALFYGGKTEFLVANSIGFGVGGIGFIDFSHYDNTLQKHVLLKGGYCGLNIEPVLFPNYLCIFPFPYYWVPAK